MGAIALNIAQDLQDNISRKRTTKGTVGTNSKFRHLPQTANGWASKKATTKRSRTNGNQLGPVAGAAPNPACRGQHTGSISGGGRTIFLRFQN